MAEAAKKKIGLNRANCVVKCSGCKKWAGPDTGVCGCGTIINVEAKHRKEARAEGGYVSR